MQLPTHRGTIGSLLIESFVGTTSHSMLILSAHSRVAHRRRPA